MMRKYPRLSLLLGMLTIGFLSFSVTAYLRAQAIINQGKQPYTIYIRQKSITYLKNKAPKVLDVSQFVARRADGSIVEGSYTRLPDNSLTLTRTIRLLPDRKKILVAGYTNTVTTEYFSDETAMRLKAPSEDAGCLVHSDYMLPVKNIGTDTVQGISVVKLLTETPQATTEFWEAPQLDCEQLYFKQTVKNQDGSIWGIAEKTVESLSLEDPSPDLFAIPIDYKEAAPSELVQNAADKWGMKICDDLKKRLPSRDAQYEASHQFRPNTERQ